MKRVLFVCTENSARSQMAEAFFNKYAKNALASSAGSRPAKNIDPTVVKIMRERGLDLQWKKPSAFAPHLNEKFDFIIRMGCHDACPVTPREKTIEWGIPDPKGKKIEDYAAARDDIERRVRKLILELGH